MGKMVGSKNTDGLLNSYNYESLPSIIRALKQFYKLEQKALRGNDAALVILADLKSGTDQYKRGPRILTDRQREIINLCLLDDLTETEVADRLGITQQSVHFCIDAAVRRIQKYLLTGQIVEKVFSPDEEAEIIRLYTGGMAPMDIAAKLDKKPKTIRSKIKNLKKSGKIARDINVTV